MDKRMQDIIWLIEDWISKLGNVNTDDVLRLQKYLEPAFAQAGYRRKGAVRSILLVRLDAIGDMVLTSPFFREVRRNYPQAFITVVCSPLTKSLLEYCPYVNEVLAFDTRNYMVNFPYWFRSLLDFCKTHLWSRHYDVCLCPQWGGGKFETMFLAWLSGSCQRYAYCSGVEQIYLGNEWNLTVDDVCLTRYLLNPPEIVTEVERHLYLLQAVGGNVVDNKLEAWYSSTDAFQAERWLEQGRGEGKIIVALGIGASHETHKYPVTQWLPAMRALMQKYPLCFILLGSTDDKEAGKYLSDNCESGQVFDFTGRTTLREAAAVLERTDLFLGNNSSMLHLSTAVKTPVVGCYREAMDKTFAYPELHSECARFVPWSEQAIMLRPDHAAGACKNIEIYGGCKENYAHCISGITAEEIIAAVSLAIDTWVR